jgi:undecaprenyl-diphosphatase
MVYLKALIYGLVQGLTEFLPVSSSGHLVLLHQIMPLPFADNLSFDVMLHLGTLLAIVLYFRTDIKVLLMEFFASFRSFPQSLSTMPWILLIASLPAVIVGAALDSLVSKTLETPLVVATTLTLVAILFLWIERRPETFTKTTINLPVGLKIGLAQAVAIIPGVSRSGATIIAGLAQGLKRETAVRFSFLLSIPIIAGASLKKVPVLFHGGLLPNEYVIISIAFGASFLAGLWAIEFMLKFIKTKTLRPFAYYRLALAAVVIMSIFL